MKDKFSKDGLMDGYALSCVESYVLYLLKIREPQWRAIFYKSYMSFTNILDEFIYNNAEYARFTSIERLQITGQELGLINYSYIKKEILSSELEHKDSLIICINPEYIKQRYGTNLWRDDHFILIKKGEDGDYFYLNDNPKDDGELSKEQIIRIYTGKYIEIDIPRNTIVNTKDLLKAFVKRMQMEYNNQSLMYPDYLISVFRDRLTVLRDALGILRVSIKRAIMFSKWYDSDINGKEYIEFLDRIYLKLEYMRLRKGSNEKEINDIMKEIIEKDSAFREYLIERIQAI